MPGKMPDRWEQYLPLGKPIERTRFITFKVPLAAQITSFLREEDQFTPKKLVETVEKQGYSLGLVIDLTNTKRYYRSQDLTMLGVKYHKIFTEGHVVPHKKVVEMFFSIVDKFVRDESNKDKLIGVHCTHGINRTGYLVCRYMIDRLGFEPNNALEAYSTGRGYPMERENYIKDLKMGKRLVSFSANDASLEEEEEEQKRVGTDRYGRNLSDSFLWRRGGASRNGSRSDGRPPVHEPRYNQDYSNRRYGYGPPSNQGGAGWESSSNANPDCYAYGYVDNSHGAWGGQWGAYDNRAPPQHDSYYSSWNMQPQLHRSRESWDRSRSQWHDESSRAWSSRSSRH